MSKKMGYIVIGYGILLAVLAVALQQVAPALAKVSSITCLIAAGLSVLWGIMGLAGHKQRAWAVLTLAPTAFVLLSQVVQAWFVAASSTPEGFTGPLLLTALLLLTMGMLVYLLHGDRSPEFYRLGSTQRNHSKSGREMTPPDERKDS
ncbi:MAG: hypothetical protein KIT22_05005 [Verrucomicrobiae bacterium]|nr:hypothetical protein [Verrucomicrobiae bacterium]